jgi:chemotaxis protein methyltransferase CheR
MSDLISEKLVLKIQSLTGMRVTLADSERLSIWIQHRTKSLGLNDPQQYISYLSRNIDDPVEQQLLSELFTTGETFFMRDPGQMALLSREILPAIIARRQCEKSIRIWAPACASGEEVYSLLMLLEPLMPEMNNWKIDVIGSDINPDFIARARQARYREWSLRGSSEQFKSQYFNKVDDQWQLIDRVRDRARFLVLDLVNGNYPDPSMGLVDVDLILCRNVFIYMNIAAITRITDKLALCLARDGVLMTAHGELHAYRQSGLQIKIYPESIVYKKTDAVEPPDIRKIWLDDHSSQVGQPNHQFANQSPPAVGKSEPVPSSLNQTKDSIDAIMDRAWLLADRGHREEALIIANELLDTDPMQAEVHYLHAVISLELGLIAEAKEDLRKAIYLDPEFVPAYLELIILKIQEGNKNLAISLCQQAIKSLEKAAGQQTVNRLENNNISEIKCYLKHLSESLTSPHD